MKNVNFDNMTIGFKREYVKLIKRNPMHIMQAAADAYKAASTAERVAWDKYMKISNNHDADFKKFMEDVEELGKKAHTLTEHFALMGLFDNEHIADNDDENI